MTHARRHTNFHLPDFCTGNATLVVVLIVELVALVISAARAPFNNSFWIDLATTSLFLLWQGLVAAVVLCKSRPWLNTLTTARAYVITLMLVVMTALLISESIFRLGDYLSAGLMPEVFPTQHLAFLLGTGVIAFIVAGLALRYFHVSAEWRRSIELESQARIRALQARIRPHFLFNSMNTIAELTRSDPAKAEAAVEDLADLFRASLSEARNWVTLQEELDIARIYQRIEQLRLGERLHVEWQVNDLPMQTPMPSLLIQPLLENAVYHGIEPLPQGGTIVISGKKITTLLELTVSNPVPTQAGERRNGNGIALDNIRQRLDLAWPGQAQVLQSQAGGLYQITLRFPCPAPPVFKET
jgi:two-component system, LytTR family, sensor histidine kinase AlgZ